LEPASLLTPDKVCRIRQLPDRNSDHSYLKTDS